MTGTVGFYGKIPSRGDFVSHGLAGPTRQAMDTWCQIVLPASQERLGAGWTPAWMEAPIWRFHLRAGLFGPDPVAGLWFPSTDRAGRLYPLIVAIAEPDSRTDGALLDALETIALDAIEQDVAPDALAAALAAAAPGSQPLAAEPGEWWTQGAPRVAACRRRFSGLPDGDAFADMLSD